MHEWTMGICASVSCQTTYEKALERFPVHLIDNVIDNVGISIIDLTIFVQIIHHAILWVFINEYIGSISPQVAAVSPITDALIIVWGPVSTHDMKRIAAQASFI